MDSCCVHWREAWVQGWGVYRGKFRPALYFPFHPLTHPPYPNPPPPPQITVFSFPPDKGNVGTAAYLNVFGSIFRVLKASALQLCAELCCARGSPGVLPTAACARVPTTAGFLRRHALACCLPRCLCLAFPCCLHPFHPLLPVPHHPLLPPPLPSPLVCAAGPAARRVRRGHAASERRDADQERADLSAPLGAFECFLGFPVGRACFGWHPLNDEMLTKSLLRGSQPASVSSLHTRLHAHPVSPFLLAHKLTPSSTLRT